IGLVRPGSPEEIPCSPGRSPDERLHSWCSSRLMPLPPNVPEFLLEELVNLVFRHPTLSPPFPDRSQYLLERLLRPVPGHVQVGRNHRIEIVRRILAAPARQLLEFSLLVRGERDRNRHGASPLRRVFPSSQLTMNRVSGGP